MAKPSSKLKLRSQANEVLELPKSAQDLIARYCNIEVMGANCSTPYHINCGLFSRNRALVGKGRPEEIEAAAEHFFKRFNTTIKPGDSAKLKASLRDYGIGIDCSGFAVWILNELTKQKSGKAIWRYLKFSSPRSRTVSRFRPLENISAALLTGDRNARRLEDLRAVRPGDLIRALHGGHVIVVTEVGLDTSGHAFFFNYAHSAAGSEPRTGSAKAMSFCASLTRTLQAKSGLKPTHLHHPPFRQSKRAAATVGSYASTHSIDPSLLSAWRWGLPLF